MDCIKKLVFGLLVIYGAILRSVVTQSADSASSDPVFNYTYITDHIRGLLQGFQWSIVSSMKLSDKEKEMVGLVYKTAPLKDSILEDLLALDLDTTDEDVLADVLSPENIGVIKDLLQEKVLQYGERNWEDFTDNFFPGNVAFSDISEGNAQDDTIKHMGIEADRNGNNREIGESQHAFNHQTKTETETAGNPNNYADITHGLIRKYIYEQFHGHTRGINDKNTGTQEHLIQDDHRKIDGQSWINEKDEIDSSHQKHIGQPNTNVQKNHHQQYLAIVQNTSRDYKERNVDQKDSRFQEHEDPIVGITGQQDEYHDQVGGYEGCKRDYDAVAEPISIPLQKIAMRILNISGGENIPTREAQAFGPKMMDALGKLPTGLSLGHLHWIGAYDLCMSVDADYNYTQPNTTIFEHRKFRGKYCRVDLVPEWAIFGNLSLPAIARLQVGFCVPDTCTVDHVSTYISDRDQGNIVISLLLSDVLNVRVGKLYCGIDEKAAAEDPAFTAAKVIFYILLSTMAAATCYDVFVRRHFKTLASVASSSNFSTPAPPGIQHSDTAASMTDLVAGAGLSTEVDNSHVLKHQNSTVSTNELILEEPSLPNTVEKPTVTDRLEVLFVAFSAYSNMVRIFDTDLGEQKLRVLDGIRALSFIYAIAGATALFGPLIGDVLMTENVIQALLTLPGDLWFQAVINYNFSSDAFFVISGFLVTYKWLEYFDKKKKISVKSMVYFYVHRYWRFACSLMIVIFFYTSSVYYIGGGPTFPTERRDVENCKKNWWTHLLMVNNLVNTNQQCMAPQWFLSALFQLHIITPLILVPAVLKPRLGYLMLGLFQIIHLISAAVVSNDVYDSQLAYVWDFYTLFFLTPWCRAGPYFTGIALAFLIVRRKQPIKIHSLLVFLIWAAVMVVLVSVIFGTYSQLKDFPTELHRWSRGVSIMYDVLARNGFGVSVAWLILSSEWGYGGFVADFLSQVFWRPLSKLVYPSFVTYVMVTYGKIYANKTLVYGSIMNLFYMAFANVWLVYLFGLFVTSLLVHYPICLGAERAFMVSNKEQCIKAGCHRANST